MNMLRIVQGGLLAAIAATVLCWASAVSAAVPESWKDTGFSIEPAGMTLRNVIEQFGTVYGVRLAFEVSDVAVSKERLRSDTGAEFLDRIARQYRFRWFVYGDTLHIVPRDDNTSVRLEVGEDAVQDAKGALIGIGLFDSRFGWGELPDEGIVIVSGPREYVRLAREILMPDTAKAAKKEKQIMVFRLKYASATDRVISARNKTETIPGIKTILSSLILDMPDSKHEESAIRIDNASTKRSHKPNNGKGEAKEVGKSPFSLAGSRAPSIEEEEKPAPRGGKTKTSSGDVRPRIEADPSLNAIMIYDQASKREMYQTIIDQLDVQPQQIEIEALIVDIDRSKLSELGVEWGVRSRGGNVTARVNSMQTESQGVDLPLPGATLLISNAARFYARLKAMEGSGEARILATPTVLTLNNVAAVLDLSQTKYIPLLGERVADLADITAGTMLRVIPRIVNDGAATRVRLEVDIEDGSLGDAAANANVTRSTISTQAIIELQQTLMIGGYRAESLQTRQQKIPVLGDIPVLGNLFRHDTATQGTRERLFLITPRLQDPFGVAAAPTSKASESARTLVSPPAKIETPAGTMSTNSSAVQVAPANVAVSEAVSPPVEVQNATHQLATEFEVDKPALFGASVKRSSYKCGRGKPGLPTVTVSP
jgi:type III secretion protein C